MSAGEFNRRVTLQTKSTTRAANGEEVVTWGDTATVWAFVEPLRGREFFAGAQMTDAVDYRVTVRYRTGVVREMRVKYGTEYLDIVSVIEVGKKVALELMCVSGVRNGG
jgi:SPP1 family predicted phage head-tail adaptor